MRPVRCRRCQHLLTEAEARSFYAECAACRQNPPAVLESPDPSGAPGEIVLEVGVPEEPRHTCASCGQPWGRGGRMGINTCARCSLAELQVGWANEPLFRVTFRDDSVEYLHAFDVLHAEALAQKVGDVDHVEAVSSETRGGPTKS